MKQILRILSFLLLFNVFATNVQATHIVGGEMTYTHLSGNLYEISLTIFRDCYNGNPAAFFDNPARIGIYNSDNVLIDSLLIPWDSDINDTLDPILSNECLVVPPDVCVHTTTYLDTIALSPIIGGYTLIYQRCCRNQTIVNIVDPLDSGATFSVTITEKALLEENSSAKFQVWPPIYICANEPIDFDHSAVDVDGDSIVYQLCTPLLGAFPGKPIPEPWEQTVPTPVVWIDPPYNLNNVLGGVPLQIDSETGFLTGVPDNVGQFVVGICLEEYRDGVLISTTRRDFQYNVGICGETISSFFAPEVQCDGFTVDFDNQSSNANNYEWYFNDPNNPGASSTSPNPSYTYADTGLYEIMLIAEPGNTCVDTSYQLVSIQLPSLFADFDYSFEDCSDSISIVVTDQTIDTISTPTEWLWELSTGQTSTLQNPEFLVGGESIVTLSLIVTAANGCTDTLSETFLTNLIINELSFDTVQICRGDSVVLNNDFNPIYSYNWSPAAGLDNPNAPNPKASPESTTTYSVTITDAANFCSLTQQVLVTLPPPIILGIPNDTVICSNDLTLLADSDEAIFYVWSDDPNFDNSLSTDSMVVVDPIGAQTYYIFVRDSFGCTLTDSVRITGNGINVSTDSLGVYCFGEEVSLSVTNLDPTDILTYDWTPTANILSGTQSATVEILPTTPGTFTYFVATENQFGCTRLDSVLVGVLDTTPQLDFVGETQCSGYTVYFSNTSINAPYYLWNFGDPAAPVASSTAENPSYTYAGPGTYMVSLTIDAAVECKDTIFREITVNEPNIALDFEWEFEECTDSVAISFTDLSVNTQSNITGWNWFFSNGDTSTLQDPTIILTQSQLLESTLILNSDDGCIDTLSQSFPVDLIEVSLRDSLAFCQGDTLFLNPDGDTSYVYEWFPTTGLSDSNVPNPVANPLSTTIYEVTITDFSEDTCSVVRSVTVVVPPLIDLLVTNDTTLCEPSLEIMAQSNQAILYEWSIAANFDPIFSMEDSVVVMPDRPSIYHVRVTDDFGCQKTDSVIVYSSGIDLALEEVVTVCIGDSLRLNATNLNPEDDLTYFWTPGDAVIAGGNTSTPLISPGITTEYYVFVTNQFGCELRDTVTANVFNYVPPLTVDADPDTIIIGQSSQLSSTVDPGYNYNWSPSETLDDPTISTPLATPEVSTLYNLYIETAQGCSNQATLFVVVLNPKCDDPFIFIPNAFTPNGDGQNDVLFVNGNNIDVMNLAIYNRWGEKVFESDRKEKGWDGTYKGEALTPDVYGFYLTVKCFDGIEFFKKGNINLLR
ncbi:MAG: PKD domain-containing protein [Saprospiraceae bacterium]